MLERKYQAEIFPKRAPVEKFLNIFRMNGFRLGIVEDRGTLTNALTIPGSTKVFDFALSIPSLQNSREEAIRMATYAFSRLEGNDALVGNLGIGVIHDSKMKLIHTAYIGSGKLPLVYSFTEAGQEEIELILQCAEAYIEEKHYDYVPPHLFGDNEQENINNIEVLRQILQLAQDQDWSITTSESCTGGFLAKQFLQNSPRNYLGGVTLYNEQQKIKEGVSPDQLSYGNVYSEEVALAMARAACKNFNADIAIATTGVMENPDDRPFHEHVLPGTIFYAFIIYGKPFSGKIVLQLVTENGTKKNREDLKIEASTHILENLLQDMLNTICLFSQNKV